MKQISLLLALVTIVAGCGEINVYDYKGCQIVYKGMNLGHEVFKFRTKDGITLIKYIPKYDWDRYNVGDTIK